MSRLVTYLKQAAKRIAFRYLVRKPGIWIVCCHGVVSSRLPYGHYRTRNAVTIAEFRQFLNIVTKHFSYLNPHDLSSALARPSSNAGRFRRGILVTFDDGYLNNVTLAAPLLGERNLPAVFAIVTHHIGRSELLWPHLIDEVILQGLVDSVNLPLSGCRKRVPDDMSGRESLARRLRSDYKRLPNSQRRVLMSQFRSLVRDSWAESVPFPELYAFMTWDDVLQLANRGHMIASHTITHPILSMLNTDELIWELCGSKRCIESALGARCVALAYPNGTPADYNAKVIKSVKECGYKVAFTTVPGVNRSNTPITKLRRVSPQFILMAYS